jgi:hypothetical protein
MKRMKIREEGSEHVKREFKKNVHRRQTHKVRVWYHSRHVRIMVTHRNLAEIIKCNFYKITVSQRDS